MAEEEIRHPDGRIEHPQVRNEPTDVSFRWIAVILVGAMVLAVIILVAVLAFFYRYEDYQSAIRKSPFPLAPSGQERLEKMPPEPRLEQIDRLRGIEKPNVYLRETTKEAVLASYGPTDEDGFIHVPIERAMKYLASKLPARKGESKGAAEKHANGLVDSGASNSGRLFREEPKWSTK
jgi:heme/copper-type cytochrome/quinol oxidase subunit 1